MTRNTILLTSFFVFFFCCTSKSQEGKAEYMEIYRTHQSGDRQKALTMLKDYVKKYPAIDKGWTFYGVTLVEDGQDSLAEIAFNKALAINPNIKQALTGLGVIQRARGNFTEAEKLYTKSLELDPNFAEAYSSLIIIELAKKDFDQAVVFGKKALDLDKTNGTIAANLSAAYHFKGAMTERDYFFAQAEKLGYTDLGGLRLIFAGKITLDELVGKAP